MIETFREFGREALAGIRQHPWGDSAEKSSREIYAGSCAISVLTLLAVAVAPVVVWGPSVVVAGCYILEATDRRALQRATKGYERDMEGE